MSTRVGVLDRGRLVLQEDMSAIRAVTGLVRVRTPDVGAAIALLDGRVQERGTGEVVVRADDAADLNVRLVDGRRARDRARAGAPHAGAGRPGSDRQP